MAQWEAFHGQQACAGPGRECRRAAAQSPGGERAAEGTSKPRGGGRAWAHLSHALQLAQESGAEVQALPWLGSSLLVPLRLLRLLPLQEGLTRQMLGPTQGLHSRDAGRGAGDGAGEEQRPDGQGVDHGDGREHAHAPRDQHVILRAPHPLQRRVPRKGPALARRGRGFPGALRPGPVIAGSRRSSRGTRSGAGTGSWAYCSGGAQDAGAVLPRAGAVSEGRQAMVLTLPVAPGHALVAVNALTNPSDTHAALSPETRMDAPLACDHRLLLRPDPAFIEGQGTSEREVPWPLESHAMHGRARL